MSGLLNTGTNYQNAAVQGLSTAANLQTERETAKKELEDAQNASGLSTALGIAGILVGAFA